MRKMKTVVMSVLWLIVLNTISFITVNAEEIKTNDNFPVVQMAPSSISLPSTSNDNSKIAPIYTGVVIDARGMGLNPVMSPIIYNEKGKIIYGNMDIDPDVVIRKGMVDYDDAVNVAAGTSRAGSNPIVVKAIGLKDFNSDVVISQADADMILYANAHDGFLRKTSVVFEP